MPAVPQSFQAALQTQWSWMLQLCCCIEAHLKENTAYFQVRARPARLSRSVCEKARDPPRGRAPRLAELMFRSPQAPQAHPGAALAGPA